MVVHEDPDEARKRSEAALGHLRESPGPTCGRGSFSPSGRAYAGSASGGGASLVLRAARDLYDSLGAATYLKRGDRELKATGLDVGQFPDPADAVLTAARDHHVQLMAQEQAVAEPLLATPPASGRPRTFPRGEDGAVPHDVAVPEDGIRSRSEVAAAFRAMD